MSGWRFIFVKLLFLGFFFGEFRIRNNLGIFLEIFVEFLVCFGYGYGFIVKFIGFIRAVSDILNLFYIIYIWMWGIFFFF